MKYLKSLNAFSCILLFRLKITHAETNEKRDLLSTLIDTWDFLYHNELSFLLEVNYGFTIIIHSRRSHIRNSGIRNYLKIF